MIGVFTVTGAVPDRQPDGLADKQAGRQVLQESDQRRSGVQGKRNIGRRRRLRQDWHVLMISKQDQTRRKEEGGGHTA